MALVSQTQHKYKLISMSKSHNTDNMELIDFVARKPAFRQMHMQVDDSNSC